MAAIVGIISRRDLGIEVCHRNQCNMSKLVPYKPLLQFYSQLCISSKTEHFSYKGRCGMYEYTRIDEFEGRAGLGYR